MQSVSCLLVLCQLVPVAAVCFSLYFLNNLKSSVFVLEAPIGRIFVCSQFCCSSALLMSCSTCHVYNLGVPVCLAGCLFQENSDLCLEVPFCYTYTLSGCS